MTEPGNPWPKLTCPTGCDLRTDLAIYDIYRYGNYEGEVRDIVDIWN